MPVRSKSVSQPKRLGSSSDGFGGRTIQNAILLGLPSRERDSVFAKLEFVELRKHTILSEAGESMKFAYFINGGLMSLLGVMSDGKSVEVGLAGKEGFVGLPLVVGFATSPLRIVMQVEGSGFRISATDVKSVVRDCPRLNTSLQRFSQVMAMQAAQIAACNRLHEVHNRLARWLMMSQDRLGGDIAPLTQETLAQMLGTRRASVTVAAGILQKAKLITYRRGDVRIDNRRGLEETACECYQAMKRYADRWRSEADGR